MLPASIESYDAAAGTVSLKLMLNEQVPLQDGTIEASTFPPIEDVPVVWQRCGKGWLTFPLAQGDTGMVVFADRSLSKWSQTDKSEVVNPQTLSMHNLDGAVFIPGLTPPKNALEQPDTENVVLHTETKLDLGEKGLTDADNLVALAKLVKSEISALRDTVNTNVTIFNAMTLPSGMGPVGPPPVSMQAPASVGDVKCTKVRAK